MQPAVCHVVRRDSSAVKFDRVEIAFILGNMQCVRLLLLLLLRSPAISLGFAILGEIFFFFFFFFLRM